MKDLDQVYEYTIDKVGLPEIRKSFSTCRYRNDDMYEDDLKGRVVTGCFYSKVENSELSENILRNLKNSKLKSVSIPRQDFLQWTFSYTLTSDFKIGFSVDTIENSEEEDSERWKKYREGYKSVVYLHIYDKRKS